MSDIAMPIAASTYRHASWCGQKTIISDDGEARCASQSGDCAQDTGRAVSISLGDHGQPMVMLFPEELSSHGDYLDPQEALAYGLEIVQAAMLVGAKVA